MADFCDYIDWRGDLTFDVSPFNEVDNLVLAMLSFIDFSASVSASLFDGPVKITDCYAAHREQYPDGERFGQVIPGKLGVLFEKAACSVRFSDLYVTAARSVVDEEACVQFAAVTFVLPDHSLYVSYRGTDDTLVGWREDCNLSFEAPVPAQSMAAEYLEEVGGFYAGGIRTGGHSKGGNLAAYAAVSVPEPIRRRIIMAYSNDGPGLPEDVLASEAYQSMRPRLCTFVPQSSLVGMLLGHGEDYHVIESTLKDGIFQHNPFSWPVLGTRFNHLPDLSDDGKRNERVMREWLGAMTFEDRRKMTDALFTLLGSSGAKTISDLSTDWVGNTIAAIRAYAGFDKDTKETLLRFTRSLAETVIEYRAGAKAGRKGDAERDGD